MPERDHATDVATAEQAASQTSPAPPRTPAELALQLQRTIGNAATRQVLAREIAVPTARQGADQDDHALRHVRHAGPIAVRGAGENETGIDPGDVTQGSVGDCYFLSPLMSVARINPRWVRNLIRGPVGQTAIGANIYEVDLYERRWIGEPRKLTYRIDDRFVTSANGNPRYAKHGDMSAVGPEIWVMLLEKAWAAHKGGYEQTHFGLMSEGMTAVSGKDTDLHYISADDDADVFDRIAGALGSGKPVTVQTKQTHSTAALQRATVLGKTIPAAHAYSIGGVWRDSRKLNIYNPHNNNHLMEFSMADLRLFFDYYVMAEDSVR